MARRMRADVRRTVERRRRADARKVCRLADSPPSPRFAERQMLVSADARVPLRC